jgi:hypothetical protein
MRPGGDCIRIHELPVTDKSGKHDELAQNGISKLILQPHHQRLFQFLARRRYLIIARHFHQALTGAVRQGRQDKLC